jgi:hypothetical protein
MTSGRDGDQDIRSGLARDAKEYAVLLRRTLTKPDAAIDGLVTRAFGSAERLRAAAELLDEGDSEARALLVRAVRRAEDPSPPPAPTVRERPDASRFGGSEARAPAPGGVTSGGGCYSGKEPRPTS